MTIVVSDNFNRANNPNSLGSTQTGQVWEAIPWSSGDPVQWGVLNNQAYMYKSSPVFVNAGVSDCIITVKLIGSADARGLFFRQNGSVANGLNLQIENGFRIALYEVPSWSTVASTSLQAVSEMKVELKGTSIKVYLDGVLKISTTSSYNLTATKHGMAADAIGATFDDFIIEDFNTGPSGTDGSTPFDLKQTIYRDANTLVDSKQTIYKESLVSSDTKLTLYKDGSVTADSKQILFADRSTLFDTLQQLYESGVDGSFSADLLIQLYNDSQTQNDTKQTLYSDSSTLFDTLQQLYQNGVDGSFSVDVLVRLYKEYSNHYDSRQIIYNDDKLIVDSKQTFFQDSKTLADTLVIIYDPSKQIIDVINLQGRRELTIRLQAKQQPLDIQLRGKRDLSVNLKGAIKMTAINQNFSMYSGNSKNITIPVDGVTDLTGATVKWGMRKKELTASNILVKQTPEITVSGNTITIPLRPQDTADLIGDYKHECKLIDAIGNTSTIMIGTVSITKSSV